MKKNIELKTKVISAVSQMNHSVTVVKNNSDFLTVDEISELIRNHVK